MAGGSAPAVTIRLPGPLRERAGRRAAVAARGATVRAVIYDLDEQFPGMRFQLCEETGDLRPFINIFLEDANVRDLQGLDTPVTDGGTVHILLSVAGGVGTLAASQGLA
jgi:molybdopterin synthase sulfur carrier subunit